MYVVVNTKGMVLEPTREEAEAFCEDYHPTLVGSLALYVGDRLLAEELAQEALLRAFRRWERVARLDSPKGWVWRVAINIANSHFRRRAVARRAQTRLQGSRSESVSPPDVAWRVSIVAAVAELPDRQREAVVLRYVHDLSAEEAGARMGASADAVRSLTKRAVATLRAQFTAELTEDHDG